MDREKDRGVFGSSERMRCSTIQIHPIATRQNYVFAGVKRNPSFEAEESDLPGDAVFRNVLA
jgi:hypothetical protein